MSFVDVALKVDFCTVCSVGEGNSYYRNTFRDKSPQMNLIKLDRNGAKFNWSQSDVMEFRPAQRSYSTLAVAQKQSYSLSPDHPTYQKLLAVFTTCALPIRIENQLLIDSEPFVQRFFWWLFRQRYWCLLPATTLPVLSHLFQVFFSEKCQTQIKIKDSVVLKGLMDSTIVVKREKSVRLGFKSVKLRLESSRLLVYILCTRNNSVLVVFLPQQYCEARSRPWDTYRTGIK